MVTQTHLLVSTIIISTCIYALCWAFMIVIWCQEYLILSDSVVHLITRYPTVLTLISTVISTTLSVIITALFSFAAKNMISHYITRPISLVELHAAIALTRPQPLLRWNHPRLSFVTFVIFGWVTLLNSSWTTLLLPTALLWPVPIQGKDLDLGSPAFDAQLYSDLQFAGNRSYTNAFGTLDILVPISGISATRLAVAGGDDSIFAFNGVSYRKTTSGIVPAVEDFAGSTSSPGGIALQYYGGKVAVNTSVINEAHQSRSGLAQNYTVTQQGVSANISCSALDPNQFSLTRSNDTLFAFGTETIAWQWTATCPAGVGVNYWATANFSDVEEEDTPYGLLGIIVCPNLAYESDVPSFDILLQGRRGYGFLNATVCKVAPYVASFDVTYNKGNISIDQPRNVQPLQDNVTAFISRTVMGLSTSTQTTYNNPLGQLLLLSRGNTSSVNEMLVNYLHGVVEFSATYLRSAYLADGAATAMPDLYSDESAFKTLNGTMYVTTYGWFSGRLTYIYVIGVFTVVWGFTVLAATYSLIQERAHPSIGHSFNVSDPVQLMMASSAGGLQILAGFERGGVAQNESLRVRVVDGQDGAHNGSMRFEIIQTKDGGATDPS